MRTTNTFGIQIILRRNKMKNNLCPIYARIVVDQTRREISLKEKIHPDSWDEAKGNAKGTRPEIKKLNNYLAQIRSNITECYRELNLENKLVTADEIKNKYLGIEEKGRTLCNLVEYHNNTQKEVLTWGTMKNYYTTQNYITKFLKEKYKTSDIYLSSMNYKFIMDFEYYLRTYEPTDHQRPMQHNGVMKHIERFRKMVRMAVKMEWLEKDPFERYSLKFKKVEREFLTAEELAVIENKQFKIKRFSWVRDLFVFSCYTGLAYIDTMKLTPDNLTRGIDKQYWIVTQRQKTTTPVRIPLLPKAMEIINRYKEDPKALNKGTLFPNISNQKLNSYLKEIADLCGIEKELTFHMARHTFATTVTLTNGVPIETVSKMLGHTKITTTQIYARVLEHKISSDMMDLRKQLETKNKPQLKRKRS